MRNKLSGFFFNVVAAFAVIFTALICLVNLYDLLGGLQMFITIMLFVSGVLYILSFVQSRKTYFKPGWILSQGFLFLFIGAYFLLTDSGSFTEKFLTSVFSLMAICSAASQIACSIQLKTLEIKHWKVPALCGIINLSLAFIIILEIISVNNVIIYELSAYMISVAADTLLEFFVRKG